MTDEVDEMSAASRGSRPVAWAVWSPAFGYPFGDAAIFKRNELAMEMCVMNGYGVDDIIPLYRKPMLADEELKAIRRAAAVAREMHDSRLEAALGNLLERLG
jgi:hypothetical protein